MALSPTSSHEGLLALRSQTTEITSAQMLASFTTPVVVLPDPGTGVVVLPWSLTCSSHGGSTAYTLAGSMHLGGGTGFDLALTGITSLAGSNPPLISYDFPAYQLQTSFDPAQHAAITLSADTGNPTGGDYAITATFLYLLLAA